MGFHLDGRPTVFGVRGAVTRRSCPRSAFAVVWALVRGNGAGWDSAEVLATLAAG